MSRYVVVLPLSPLQAGEGFTVAEWPLHVTLVPPFATDAPAIRVIASLAAIATSTRALRVTAVGEELFGSRNNVPVTVLEASELTRLHAEAVAGLEESGAAHLSPGFVGAGYRPHVTITRHGRVDVGDKVLLTQIALVDMAPRAPGHPRVVVAVFPLSEA